MFTLGNGKEIFIDDGTGLQVREVSDLLDLLRAQEQLLDRAMSRQEMSVYETHAQQISELLDQMINFQHGPKWPS